MHKKKKKRAKIFCHVIFFVHLHRIQNECRRKSIFLHLYIFTKMKQEIQNINLVLTSEEGIKPLLNYVGVGRLTKDSTGFHFIEKKRITRTKNQRVAKLCEGTFIMYEVRTGRFKMQIMLDENEMNQKAILEKVRPLLKEAKEGGMI